MNMHGIFEPLDQKVQAPSPRERVVVWARRNRALLLVVVLPLLLATAYLYLVVSDQYESEAHFLVRKANDQPTPGIGVSQVLSAATGLSASQGEEMSLADYLTSHDAVAELRRGDRLVERFHRSDVDLTSRLWSADPKPETLLKYYNHQVSVKYDTDTGSTTLKVRSFRPQDSYDLARTLLDMGERRVNELNARSYDDAVALSRRQLAEAEQAIAQNQRRMTSFRQTRGDIDPKASAQAQIGLVSTMSGQLAAARAQLAAMGHSISSNSPQYQALANRVRAIESQVAAQSSRLTGNSSAIAADIGGYEDLRLRQDFLEKRYDAAAASLEKAREEALRQQLYVVRVVDANMPVKSLYPQRMRILATLAIILLLTYAIGWLIVAGVREHAA